MPAKFDTSNLEYKDMFGRDIKVGDYIVYAGVDGRSGVLRAGRVSELSYGRTAYDGPGPKIVCDTWNYGNTVEYIHETPGDWRSKRTAVPFSKSGKQSKRVSLGFLERLIIVPEDYVHPKVKEDLAGPEGTAYGL